MNLNDCGLHSDYQHIKSVLKGLGTDIYGQNKPQRTGRQLYAHACEQFHQTTNEKVIVLIHSQYPQIQQDIGHGNPSACPSASLRHINADTTGIAAHGSNENQEKKHRVPPAIEHVAGKHNEYILHRKIARRHKPINQKDNRQKEQEFK